jgi:hypothetical protein
MPPSTPQEQTIASQTNQSLTVIARLNDTIPNFWTATKTSLQFRDLLIEAPGNPRDTTILIFFEPFTGTFAWILSESGATSSRDLPEDMRWFKENDAISLHGGKLILFAGSTNPGLSIYEDGNHAANMNDAEQKALDAAAKLNTAPGSLYQEEIGWRSVALPGLGQSFVVAPGSAAPGMAPKITGARWNGLSWIVTLQARWTASVILDANFNVIKYAPRSAAPYDPRLQGNLK